MIMYHSPMTTPEDFQYTIQTGSDEDGWDESSIYTNPRSVIKDYYRAQDRLHEAQQAPVMINIDTPMGEVRRLQESSRRLKAAEVRIARSPLPVWEPVEVWDLE